ncbi:glycosyltransferase [Alistipes sp.]|uniref:glycosyltransferase n=1 Tax=Alistipes sp. TaxID=1872444 RepID=UPI003AB42791
MAVNILCVVVLYKMQLNRSASFLSLYRQVGDCDATVDFFIYDNSPLADVGLSEFPDIHYFHCPGNTGLGTAYNAAARYAEEKGFDWVLLLDQDTVLPDNFLQSYVKAIQENPGIQVFAPRVSLSGKSLLSPMKRWRKQATHLVAEKTYPIRQYLVINSGLCVKTSLFMQSGGYDEKVWLDFADMQFIRKLLHVGVRCFYLLSCECMQHFSNLEADPEKLKQRFDIYIACARNCEYFDMADWIFRQYCVLSHTIGLTIRTRSVYFLKCFFTRYLF